MVISYELQKLMYKKVMMFFQMNINAYGFEYRFQ